jgi:hypothetical protein
VFCIYLSEERFAEDRAAIFVVAIEGSIEWGITKANLFSTLSLHAVHLTKDRIDCCVFSFSHYPNFCLSTDVIIPVESFKHSIIYSFS